MIVQHISRWFVLVGAALAVSGAIEVQSAAAQGYPGAGGHPAAAGLGGGGGGMRGGGFRGGYGSMSRGHLYGSYPGPQGWVHSSGRPPSQQWGRRNVSGRGASRRGWGGRDSVWRGGNYGYGGNRYNYGSVGHRGGPRGAYGGGPADRVKTAEALPPQYDAGSRVENPYARPAEDYLPGRRGGDPVLRAGSVSTPFGNRIGGQYLDSGAYINEVPDGFKYSWWFGFTFLNNPGRPWAYPYYYPQYYQGDVRYVEGYPPVGLTYEDVTDPFEEVVVDGETYYVFKDVWYKKVIKDGKEVYEVVEPPGKEQAASEKPGEKVPAEEAADADKNKPPQPPDPFAKLKEMCAFIGNLRTFTFAVRDTMDRTCPTGQLVKVSTRRLFDVARPNRIRVRAEGVDEDRSVWYRGETLTIFDHKEKLYATSEVPQKIDDMLTDIVARYGVTLPLVDLLYSDSFDLMIRGIEFGQYLGVHKAMGADCHHLIFSGPDVEWEVWIEVGDEPVPRKVVIHYLSEDNSPRYIAKMSRWQVNPDFKDGHFTFRPAGDAKEIPLMPLGGQANVPAPKVRAPGGDQPET